MTRPSDAATDENPGAEALVPPPEPTELRRLLRQTLLDGPEGWHTDEEKRRPLCDWLWAQWATELTARGVQRRQLGDIVAGYRQELWLWLMGERTWAHTAEGLIGRIRRRAPMGTEGQCPTGPAPG